MTVKPSGESRDDKEGGEKIKDSEIKSEDEEERPKHVSAVENPSSLSVSLSRLSIFRTSHHIEEIIKKMSENRDVEEEEEEVENEKEQMTVQPSGESRDDKECGEKIKDSEIKSEDEEERPKHVSAVKNPSSLSVSLSRLSIFRTSHHIEEIIKKMSENRDVGTGLIDKEEGEEKQKDEEMTVKPSGESREDREGGEKIEDSEIKPVDEEEKPKHVSAVENPSSSTPLMEKSTDSEWSGKMTEKSPGESRDDREKGKRSKTQKLNQKMKKRKQKMSLQKEICRLRLH
ncbi:uncharacterized protein LOC130795672 [Actinidia eriantha]|uniref:uncharacterized protein LOC130795672 n=1 Tax=Actinidia eriantha TaxID=165200 RepID=UPI002585DEFD|nr:uncharacterized protein LOC130795672 [Actinidia eriantha]